MIKRNERGKLSFNSLDISIFFDDLFESCKNEEEVEWLTEQLTSHMEGSAQDKLDSLEN